MKMFRLSVNPDCARPRCALKSIRFGLLVSLTVLGAYYQAGCIFRKHTPPAAPSLPAPVRIALLPLNFSQATEDVRWVALASPVVMAEVVQAAPDLELVPLWESMPAVLQSLGNSRNITSDTAELNAARVSARWAVEGEINQTAGTFTFQVDFIPARTSQVPFRYEKQSTVDALGLHFEEAIDQFLRYLIARPLEPNKVRLLDAKQLKEIAQALDVEYGWFVPAKPGAAGRVVDDLARVNPGLARTLFSPTLYPSLGSIGK